MEAVVTIKEKLSSKQIAERTGKEHKSVLRDIRNMTDELEKDGTKLYHPEIEVIKDVRGYTSEILLNERLSLCLAAGYSVSLRMKIIDSWAELKAKAEITSYALPSNYKEALQALLEKETENERKALQIAEQNKQLAIQAPKVAYVNEVLGSHSLLAGTQIAQDLGIGVITLNAQLASCGVIRKVNGEWVLCSEWAQKGYGKTKTHHYYNSLNQPCTKAHLYWTEKGRMAIHELYEKKKQA